MVQLRTILSRVGLVGVIVLSMLAMASSLQLFGHQAFVVESGSMSPKIKTGSIVFDKSSSSYKIGDVITYKRLNEKNTVTHRVIQVSLDNKNRVFYQVKGDANPTPDSGLVAKTDVVGKVFFHIPYIGYPVSLLKTLPGLIIFIIVPATIIAYREVLKIAEELKLFKRTKRYTYNKKTTKTRPIARAKTTIHSSGRTIIGLVLVVILTVSISTNVTGAYTSDISQLSGVTITVGSW